jgi:hypothetical protein
MTCQNWTWGPRRRGAKKQTRTFWTLREPLAVLKDTPVPHHDTPLPVKQTPLPRDDPPLPDTPPQPEGMLMRAQKKGRWRENEARSKHKSSPTRGTPDMNAAAATAMKHWAAATTTGQRRRRRRQSRRT